MMKTIRNVMAANRGEIAIRIFRACTELGLQTTAIYSWEDRLSIHRYKADRAYQVGQPGAPVRSYLDGESLMELALEKGVDAIHPGYGFLSENADFAQRCIDAGLVWIGPKPEVMRALGDKVSARKVAVAAGVPIIPGTPEPLANLDEARAFIAEHGYPVLIKAAHGGGGRGMRVVEREQDLEPAWRAARGEAAAAFGNDEVFVERYLRRPRHIEVQLLGDLHGNIVHLFERDCSIQRRHQKVVEIAPAPNLPDEVRERVYEYSLTLARALGYSSAGTVEFLVEERDGEHHVYFIEVNTRIQVEHTVTEMITGHDLIKAMIRVAEGHRLDAPCIGIASQEALTRSGVAIQARVTTEDPDNGFAPDTGTIITYRSAAGFGIRLDAGVGGAGSEVLPYYDSLLVKVCAWGREMGDATQRLGRSLAEFRIRGVKTNIPFLDKVIRHPAFLKGQTWTRFVDETPSLFEFPPRRDRANKALLAISDVIVNGPPGVQNQLVRPAHLIEPKAPAAPREAPPVSPAYAVFKERGAEGLRDWLRAQPRLLITDTTFRDAHQSLLATRVRTRDLLQVAPATAHMLPELFSYEMWGGATFDVCMRFLLEDPWERLHRLRQRLPGALLQMLLRGSNAVGYKNYPDNVVRAFVQEAAHAGLDVFRVFDALNYLPNMEVAFEEIHRAGKIIEASICYTGDVGSPRETKYTLDYYTKLAKELEARGAHILAIKDMAGLLKPRSARLLIRALKDACGLPIHLHTHDTSGNGVAMYLAAAEADVDVVDCALSSMSGLTSQPSFNAVVAALEGDPRQPVIDQDHLQRLSDYWERVRTIYAPFESGLKASTTDVYYHEIPGGQYSNLKPQADLLGLGERWAQIRDTYHDVNQALGNIIKVTPTSKAVGDFAMFLVQQGMSVEELMERYRGGEQFDLPQSVMDLLGGMMGQPYGGFPEELQRFALRGAEPIVGRPGESLPDYDWGAPRKQLTELLGRDPKRSEEISYALYPKVFRDFAAKRKEMGDFELLDTSIFLYGMEPDEERLVQIEEGKTLVVKFILKGPVDERGLRRMYFQLNGQPREILVRDLSVKLATAAREQADPLNPQHIGAPMPGKVIGLPVEVGAQVEKGQLICTLEAMKMETGVSAAQDGSLVRLPVKINDQVQAGDLIAVIEPSQGSVGQ
jgi:pyruvate carboxylase